MKGEFHIHTTSSDGVLTVYEILDIVQDKVNFLSITDHDTIASSLICCNISHKYNIKSFLGIELSTSLNNESIHILGYFPDTTYSNEIEEYSKTTRINRFKRLHKIKELLFTHFQIDLDITNLSEFKSVSRGSIAREIIKQGYPYSQQEIFDKFIGEDCLAYVPLDKFTPLDAINLIHKCKGIAVLAHPVLIKKNNIREILELGCDGIEAIYPLNTESDTLYYKELAKEYNLLITAGNDFHHFNDPKHADLLTLKLEGEDLKAFLKALNYEC